ncbi:rhomboid-like protein 19 isoform X1 [Primulina tabacum]|uniref:rhomboid-like protein 19 isoform X1 n=1 Tax=Primulina tabacum TaxID=48773 RepID=UPI003F5A0463
MSSPQRTSSCFRLRFFRFDCEFNNSISTANFRIRPNPNSNPFFPQDELCTALGRHDVLWIYKALQRDGGSADRRSHCCSVFALCCFLSCSYSSQVVISTIGLLFLGKLLEPIWGSREFLKFIFAVNFLTSVCVFITAISLYYITREESYLYVPISGFQGVLSGLLVGIKQITPDQELSWLKLKAKWLPSLALLVAVVVSFFNVESASSLPTLIFGTYIGWIYLRYWQHNTEMKRRGDSSDDFAFSTFFPDFLRPVINPVAAIFERMLCGRRSETSEESRVYTLGGSSFPGSDPIEASRRRQRGARALEERLGSERLAAAGTTEEKRNEDATENV